MIRLIAIAEVFGELEPLAPELETSYYAHEIHPNSIPYAVLVKPPEYNFRMLYIFIYV